MGGAAGRQVQLAESTPFNLSPGGNIINTLASGSVINDSSGTVGLPAVVGGITGGGGDGTNTLIKGCVSVGPRLDAAQGGIVNHILGQWGNSGFYADNYYRHDQVMTGTAVGASIGGTSIMHDILKTRSMYDSLYWDFSGVWKMGPVYPVLDWE
jgi:hypothetical protein